MEKVVFKTHAQLMTLSCAILSPIGRILLEGFIFMLAFVSFVVLFSLHLQYISSASNAQDNCVIAAMKQYSDVCSNQMLTHNVCSNYSHNPLHGPHWGKLSTIECSQHLFD